MQKFLVVDASVALKWYIREDGTQEASKLLEKQHYGLIAPDILYGEVANILWQQVRSGKISADYAGMSLGTLVDLEIEIIETRRCIKKALHIASDNRCDAIYDCIYLAAAEMEAANFITADRRFYRSIKNPSLKANMLLLESSS